MKTTTTKKTAAKKVAVGSLAKSARPKMPLDKLKVGKVVKLPQPKPAPGPLRILPSKLKPHGKLGRIGLLPDLIARETKMGNGQGKGREAHKERAVELGGEFDALCQSILADGIREPIKVVKSGKAWLIVDGRHRWEAAKWIVSRQFGDATHQRNARQIEQAGVPCIEVQEAEVPAIILNSNTRRHLSKGAIGYLAVTLFPEVGTTEKRGGDRSKTALNAVLLTAESLAKKVGVSTRSMEDAIALYKQFIDRVDAREKFEPTIFAGVGLKKVKAAVASYIETGREDEEDEEDETDGETDSAKKRAAEYLVKYLTRLRGLETSWRNWETLTPEGRKSAASITRTSILAAPEDVKAVVREALAAEATA